MINVILQSLSDTGNFMENLLSYLSLYYNTDLITWVTEVLNNHQFKLVSDLFKNEHIMGICKKMSEEHFHEINDYKSSFHKEPLIVHSFMTMIIALYKYWKTDTNHSDKMTVMIAFTSFFHDIGKTQCCFPSALGSGRSLKKVISSRGHAFHGSLQLYELIFTMKLYTFLKKFKLTKHECYDMITTINIHMCGYFEEDGMLKNSNMMFFRLFNENVRTILVYMSPGDKLSGVRDTPREIDVFDNSLENELLNRDPYAFNCDLEIFKKNFVHRSMIVLIARKEQDSESTIISKLKRSYDKELFLNTHDEYYEVMQTNSIALPYDKMYENLSDALKRKALSNLRQKVRVGIRQGKIIFIESCLTLNNSTVYNILTEQCFGIPIIRAYVVDSENNASHAELGLEQPENQLCIDISNQKENSHEFSNNTITGSSSAPPVTSFSTPLKKQSVWTHLYEVSKNDFSPLYNLPINRDESIQHMCIIIENIRRFQAEIPNIYDLSLMNLLNYLWANMNNLEIIASFMEKHGFKFRYERIDNGSVHNLYEINLTYYEPSMKQGHHHWGLTPWMKEIRGNVCFLDTTRGFMNMLYLLPRGPEVNALVGANESDIENKKELLSVEQRVISHLFTDPKMMKYIKIFIENDLPIENLHEYLRIHIPYCDITESMLFQLEQIVRSSGSVFMSSKEDGSLLRLLLVRVGSSLWGCLKEMPNKWIGISIKTFSNCAWAVFIGTSNNISICDDMAIYMMNALVGSLNMDIRINDKPGRAYNCYARILRAVFETIWSIDGLKTMAEDDDYCTLSFEAVVKNRCYKFNGKNISCPHLAVSYPYSRCFFLGITINDKFTPSCMLDFDIPYYPKPLQWNVKVWDVKPMVELLDTLITNGEYDTIELITQKFSETYQPKGNSNGLICLEGFILFRVGFENKFDYNQKCIYSKLKTATYYEVHKRYKNIPPNKITALMKVLCPNLRIYELASQFTENMRKEINMKTVRAYWSKKTVDEIVKFISGLNDSSTITNLLKNHRDYTGNDMTERISSNTDKFLDIAVRNVRMLIPVMEAFLRDQGINITINSDNLTVKALNCFLKPSKNDDANIEQIRSLLFNVISTNPELLTNCQISVEAASST